MTLNRLSQLCLGGLLLVSPVASTAASWENAELVTVVMVDDHFQPDHLRLQTGRVYDLRLENHGKEMHEFTAPAFWKAATVRDKGVLVNGGTDVVVQAGKSVNIVLIAPPRGNYDLTCADHDWDGMVGGITVE